MRFPQLLKIAVFADIATDGLNKTWDIDNRYYRVGERLSELFSKALGFKYVLLPSVDGEFGRLLPDGNWTGMIGMVHRGEADMAISEIAITENRRKVVQYSFPFTIIDVTFVTQRPDSTSDLTTIFEPFSFDVWIVFLIYQILMPVALYSILRKNHSFQRVALKTFGAFLGQQMFRNPRKLALRLLVISWLIGMMLMSHFYKAHVLSTLTFPTLRGVRHIVELASEVEKGTYECVTYAGSYYTEEFLKSSESTFQVIGHNLEKNRGSSDVEEVLYLYRKSAFIGPKPDFMHLRNKYFVSSDICFNELPAIVMSNNFCCKNKLDEVIFRMNSGGLYKKILEDESLALIINDFAELEYPKVETVKPLTLENFQSTFLLSGIGYIISIVVFAIEIAVCRQGERKNE